MRNNKAQGMPINVLIIAVLAMAVLVIVLFILFGGVSKFQTGLSDCKAKGGTECKNLTKGEKCADNEAPAPGICKGDLVCCIPIS